MEANKLRRSRPWNGAGPHGLYSHAVIPGISKHASKSMHESEAWCSGAVCLFQCILWNYAKYWILMVSCDSLSRNWIGINCKIHVVWVMEVVLGVYSCIAQDKDRVQRRSVGTELGASTSQERLWAIMHARQLITHSQATLFFVCMLLRTAELWNAPWLLIIPTPSVPAVVGGGDAYVSPTELLAELIPT